MKAHLSDIARIRSGYQFRTKVQPDPTGAVPVIQMRDITADFRLRMDNLSRVAVDRILPYTVKHGDVLFLARGHRFGAIPVTDEVHGTIATGFFFILTPERNVRFRYLAWAVNQADFRERMRPLVRGSHIPLITKRDFENLWIRVPPIAVQDSIVAIDELHRKENQLVAAIQQRRGDLIAAACRMATRGAEHQEDK